ncbi:MAG: YibE/F family protein [Synergistaceae bacterium]|nr:YibE/F family protein [Synergistaceae bacterium]
MKNTPNEQNEQNTQDAQNLLSILKTWEIFARYCGGCAIRFALALLLAVTVYSAADIWTLWNWDSEESLVVEIVDIGSERILSASAESGNGGGEPFQTAETEIAARILTGAETDRVFSAAVTRMKDGGVELEKGRRYILFTDTFEDGSMQYSIADAFRAPSVAGVITFACACLAVFAGHAGMKALLGLLFSIAALLWGAVPLMSRGFQPVPLAFAAVVFISGVTVFCVVRRGRRAVAFFGALGGVAGAFLLGRLMVGFWRLSGLAGENAPLLLSTLPGIDIRGILLAAVVISAVGAVLDVSVSITATLSELAEHDPGIAPLDLWDSGLRVGTEVLGSMINTLILAYLGSSLPMAVLISSAGADFWGLMNDPYVGQEIVHSVAGTSGLLLTIPITAAFFVLREKFLTPHGVKDDGVRK